MENRSCSSGINELFSEIVQCGEEKCLPGHEYGGLRYRYLLHIIRKGEGDFFSCGKRWHLKKGDAFMIFPESRNLYRADKERPWHYYWVEFSWDDSKLFETLALKPENPVLHTDSEDLLYETFLSIREKNDSRHPADILANAAGLRLILSKLLEDRTPVPADGLHSGRSGAGHARTIQNYINAYYSTPICVGDVIEYIGLERTYISNLFRKETGTTLGSFLREVRLSHAEKLLKKGYSVKETAYSVGYRDYENFLKTFKKYKGITPGKLGRG